MMLQEEAKEERRDSRILKDPKNLVDLEENSKRCA